MSKKRFRVRRKFGPKAAGYTGIREPRNEKERKERALGARLRQRGGVIRFTQAQESRAWRFRVPPVLKRLLFRKRKLTPPAPPERRWTAQWIGDHE